MKKQLPALAALAVLGAASGVVQAQPAEISLYFPTASSSFVTLFGIADAAIGKATSAGDQKWGFQSNSIVTSNARSMMGLTGKEDLGGGSWAGFAYSGQVDLSTGEGGGFTREAFVSLGNNNWGTVMLGRNYSPGFIGQITYELTHFSQYSVIGDTFGPGASPDPFRSAQIEYMTPFFYGLRATLAYIPKADGVLVDAGTSNLSDEWAMNVVYDQGPIKAALTADKPSHTQMGGNANKTNWTLGGSYMFGNSFVLSASYNRTNDAQHWQGAPSAVFGARRYGFELGGSVFMGPFSVTLDLTRDTKNELYGGKKYTNGLLEGRYNLSKRTYLYVDYLRLDGDSNYGLGIDHTF